MIDAERPCLGSAVLTGGQSQRMGHDKALLTVRGQLILERTLAVLRLVADDTVIVGVRPEYHGRGAEVVADRYPGSAALGGIATALETSGCERVLVVACDMPFLSSAILLAMARLDCDYDALVPVTERAPSSRQATMYHSLHAIYSRSCLPAMRTAIEAQEFRISTVLEQLRVVRLPEAWMRARDPRLRTLVNVNTPEELAEALRMYGIEIE